MSTRYRGILFFLAATLLFATLDVTSKYLVALFTVPLLVWARYSVHLIIMLIAIAPGMGREIVITKHPFLMTLRGLMLVGVTVLIQLALHTLPLAETTALIFVTPLIVALMAGPILGETVGLRSWLATIVGFCGVLLIPRPGSALAGIGVVYALGAALCYAGYQIVTRKLSSSEPPMRQLFYTALVGAISMSFVMPHYWTGEIPSPRHALLIASLGVLGGTGHFLLIRALRDTPASILSPLLYVQLIWATTLGWLVFGHLPDLQATVGMLVIGLAGLSLLLFRSRHGKTPDDEATDDPLHSPHRQPRQ